jgi:hypothetical protein
MGDLLDDIGQGSLTRFSRGRAFGICHLTARETGLAIASELALRMSDRGDHADD